MSKLVEYKKGFILPALMYIIAGAILLVCPEITTKTITYAVGVIFIVMGLSEIVNYLRMEPDLASTSTGFVNGTLTTLIGLFIFLKSETVISIIPIILGFMIIISGTLKLQHAINLYRIKMSGVKGIVIIGFVNIIIGVITVFNPFKTVVVLMRIMGIGLLVSGLTDIGASTFMKRQFKKYSHGVEAKCIEDKKNKE